jgi:hypothetical protein
MHEWSDCYKKAHAALKAAPAAIEKLVEAEATSENVIARVCCAGDALHGVRALLDEAGQLQQVPRPRVALDVEKILRTARLNRGRKRRQLWDSGVDVFRQLDEMHRADPAGTRQFIGALQSGLEQALLQGLAIAPSGVGL